MRNHHHHHQQLASLKFITIFNALLLNGQLANAGDGAASCYAPLPTAPTCPALSSNDTLFPFLSSQACGSASSFFISGCTSSSNISEKPKWPSFVKAMITDGENIGAPFVMDIYNPFQTPAAPPPLPRDSNSSTGTNGTKPLDPAFGLINLTWSDTLVHQNACRSRLSPNQISHYLPHIDLTSFAHGVFELSPSNIILLCNCTSPASASDQRLQKNSTACTNYAKECGLQKNESSNCYQFTPRGGRQKLNVSNAMKKFDCEDAMFFVVSQLSIPASEWRPGLIQLNWSTSNNIWMTSNLESCEGCLQSNGSCGYNLDDSFLCYCAQHRNSSTHCMQDDKSSECRSFGCGVKLKVIIGAGSFGIALALSLTLFCILKRKAFMKSSVSCSSPHVNTSWMKKPSFLSRKQDQILAKEMSYQEIVHATESFANTHMLGDGGFGAVYKGVLADGRKVAVKRLYHDNCRRVEHFFNELKVLSNLNHPNLVKLYGFCYEDEKELLLVFEYAPQGTVSDHLHSELKPPMSWTLRLNIACETAEALSYLHNSVNPPIYHRDVKTTNILLDEGCHAKLADFGLSKLVPLSMTHVSTAPQGTPGYLDPDYHQCYQLTDKSDVYSLGVVLMELISAKLAVDMSRNKGEINLSRLAVMKVQCGRLEELVDPSLEMKKNPCVERSIKRAVELAFQCLQVERDERPSMRSVAETLAEIRTELADGDAEALLNLHGSTQNTPTTCQSCVSSGPNKPLLHSQDSPRSVCFSSSSSKPSSNLSSS